MRNFPGGLFRAVHSQPLTPPLISLEERCSCRITGSWRAKVRCFTTRFAPQGVPLCITAAALITDAWQALEAIKRMNEGSLGYKPGRHYTFYRGSVKCDVPLQSCAFMMEFVAMNQCSLSEVRSDADGAQYRIKPAGGGDEAAAWLWEPCSTGICCVIAATLAKLVLKKGDTDNRVRSASTIMDSSTSEAWEYWLLCHHRAPHRLADIEAHDGKRLWNTAWYIG
ncbi:hypothetical protein E2C01_060280 [Portunus trituberculatus]|uniref:Uncharacterized protein n=1 Tax=Portunus trituberculatus TaxID=210409 RepID=A0A5B7HBL9_PORTR|nr:hypothetical protein [Portunus trituberculatus]